MTAFEAIADTADEEFASPDSSVGPQAGTIKGDSDDSFRQQILFGQNAGDVCVMMLNSHMSAGR